MLYMTREERQIKLEKMSNTRDPVSYTHLEQLRVLYPYLLQITYQFLMKNNQHNTTPVSYTHLDVYKRQQWHFVFFDRDIDSLEAYWFVGYILKALFD